MLLTACGQCESVSKVSNLFPPDDLMAEWGNYPDGSPRGEFVKRYTAREEVIYQQSNGVLLGPP